MEKKKRKKNTWQGTRVQLHEPPFKVCGSTENLLRSTLVTGDVNMLSLVPSVTLLIVRRLKTLSVDSVAV